MEVRARAGKNVGKMNFNPTELTQFLVAHGDVRNPMPETIRVLDEIVTEFIQGISFEATRVAQYAGRQKVKYEDFEFAMRRNPTFLGKVQDNFEIRRELEATRKILSQDELADLGKEFGPDGQPIQGGSKRGRKPKQRDNNAAEEELGEADDDAQADADTMGAKKK